MSNTCQVCGTDNGAGIEYCEGCGVEIQASTLSAPETDVEPSGTTPEVSGHGGEQLHGGDPGWGGPSEWREELTEPNLPHDYNIKPSPTSTSAESGSSHLMIKRYGALTGEAFPLQGSSLIVGRFDPSTGPVDIDVTGMPGAEHISRRHAEVYAEGSNWMVKDLGSTNGVFIKRSGNDHYEPRLQEPAMLHDGDEVAFGNVVFVYRSNS